MATSASGGRVTPFEGQPASVLAALGAALAVLGAMTGASAVAVAEAVDVRDALAVDGGTASAVQPARVRTVTAATVKDRWCSRIRGR
ncbi:MAG TPA: hypothetical protein VIG76_11320 [Amnibacterium sp.]|jgi:hypothetical protein|uniref:hypothetical protein n=1 Tax=Amnibacterium sp. TaxID=1872496 RepID=UPI002F92A26C